MFSDKMNYFHFLLVFCWFLVAFSCFFKKNLAYGGYKGYISASLAHNGFNNKGVLSMLCDKNNLGESTPCFEIPIRRRDVDNLIMLDTPKIPGMLAGITEEDSIREAIEVCFKNALERDGRKITVFTNGSLTGPTIKTVVQFVN